MPIIDGYSYHIDDAGECDAGRHRYGYASFSVKIEVDNGADVAILRIDALGIEVAGAVLP